MANKYKYDPLLADIGRRIIACRTAKQMNANELALRADMQATALSTIENGHRDIRISTFLKICNALGVRYADLLPNSDVIDNLSDD